MADDRKEIHYDDATVARAAALRAQRDAADEEIRKLARPSPDTTNTLFEGWVVEEGNPPEQAVILMQADGCYTVDGESIAVSDNEDCVLQAFIAQPAMDQSTLIKKSGVELAPRVLSGLAKKYGGKLAPYITLPRVKGKGGYAVKIRRHQ